MDKYEDVIQDLIKTCRDGEKGYKEAADHAKSSDLKSRFLAISSERGRFADELQSELTTFDRDAKADEGHLVGAIHRGWIDIKQALGGGDHSLLAWLEKGDDYAKGKYQNALKANLPVNSTSLVRRQYEILLRQHDEIKAMRDAHKAA